MIRKYSKKVYFEAIQYLGPYETPEKVLQEWSNSKTYIKENGKLDLWINDYEHIGVPLDYWIVKELSLYPNKPIFKTYNNEVFKRLFTYEC